MMTFLRGTCLLFLAFELFGLRCVRSSQEISVNCTFDESYCGWRNLVTSAPIKWYQGSGTSSQGTRPSMDHNGGGQYIYAESSNATKANQTAELLSPLIRGPKCFRFFYHLSASGLGVGILDVSLKMREKQSDYSIWQKSGNQVNQWIKASVDIGYNGECQAVLKATIGKNFTGTLAVDDVTLSDGLCEEERDPRSNPQGNCNFDHDLCFWRSDTNFVFKWTQRRHSTRTVHTGPNSDHTSGNGMYIYIEASNPRRPGDAARLESPWMRGPQCMTFYYHMFGSTMSCVVIYIRNQTMNRLRPVWLKSEDQGERWIQGRISINETSSFQIVIDGIRGGDAFGDAALDDFIFQSGTCHAAEETTYFVYLYKSKDFRISSQSFEHKLGYSEEFQFTLEHPRGNPTEVVYFLYPEALGRQSFVTSKLDLSDHENFPIGVVVLNSDGKRRNSRKVYLIDRSNNFPMISLDDHRNVNCFKGNMNFSFYAFNVTEPGNRSISIGCTPGWFRIGKSCYLFHIKSTRVWRNARTSCHRLGADLAVVNDPDTLEALAIKRRKFSLDDRDFFLGLSNKLRWRWLDGESVSNADNLWSPIEPSGDGKCGSFLNTARWAYYSSRLNDERCTSTLAYICEQYLDLPLPVAFFSLRGANGTLDLSPSEATKAVSHNITMKAGPFGNPNGAFLFRGDKKSYFELKNTGELDTRFSLSVFAWVHLENFGTGPILEFGCSIWVSFSTLEIKAQYTDRKSLKSILLRKEGVLRAKAWNFIGTTYDYRTGLAAVWVNDQIVLQRKIGAKMELATQTNVRVGASNDEKTQFHGRMSCLQFYHQALSVDQIIKVKGRCNQTTPFACDPKFFAFHGGCFSINTKNPLTWTDALAQCNGDGGTLAKISREGLRYAFSEKLWRMTPRIRNLHIGLVSQDYWTWVDGSPMNESLWMPGNPASNHDIQICAVLSAGSSRMRNVECRSTFYPLCQKQAVSSLSYQSWTQSSSVLLPYEPFMAIDRSYSTCFRSQKESNPWWQVTLEKPSYVQSVEITDTIDCCVRDSGIITVTVSTNQAVSDQTCAGSLKYGGKTQNYKVHCSPPSRGSYVTVTLTGDNVTLVLCQVVVRTIEFPEEVHGVLRQGWYGTYSLIIAIPMRVHPVFKNSVQSQTILQDFDAPINMAENYVQRLTAYLQVPESGNYTFYISCDDMCELWIHEVTENGIEEEDKKAMEGATKEPLIFLTGWTRHLEWNKYPQQISQPIFMNKCRFYRMEAFMREKTINDHISVGMRIPSGEYERPIPGKRLFWTKPGTRKLMVTLKHQNYMLSAFLGLELRISGFYQFCCDGVYCPDCPLELNISTLGQNVTVDSAVSLFCVNTSFTAVFNTNRQPGIFTVKVIYSFVDNSEQASEERVIGLVRLQAAVLKECQFESGYCDWSTQSYKDRPRWKLSTERTYQYPGHFAHIDDSYKAQLESPLLTWKQFHHSVGLCLRFSYLMPSRSRATLKVYFRDPKQEEPVLAWQLVGYHGEGWSAALVAWSGVDEIKVIFEGEGVFYNTVNIAIDDVIITVENCALSPYFAEPGFRCGFKQFTCNNGECVKENLQCDSDFACKDGSDEENCKCPSNKFACQDVKCLPVTALCDGKVECLNGDDENNCQNPCPSSHQCLDGLCISWSNTCSQRPSCGDGSNTPSVCGYGKCLLNDLGCATKTLTAHQGKCRSFRGHCGFQNGHCGLKSDKNATFFWTVGSGQTPTAETGPTFDHTSLNIHGSYIFIEASKKNPGDKARLLSGWMEPSETICLQFWYHMYGSNIGNLSIYMKTNQSETSVWRLSGDQGNRWSFGQTALYSPQLYRFVIEGTVGDGSKGDIALDDLTVFDGNCKKVVKQASPYCDFEVDFCDWRSEKGWIIDRQVKGFRNTGGSVVSLPTGASNSPSLLSSPVINIYNYEWKCLRFWYFIGSNNRYEASLKVVLKTVTSNETTLLFFADGVTSEAQYTQVPLSSNYTNAQIDFVGRSEHSEGPSLALDDISFSKEPCEKIPRDSFEALECQESLGMENGAILDGQISASSEWSNKFAASQGRLHFQKTSWKAGSWSAGINNVNQWLQVDLGTKGVRVTRIATQGRNDYNQSVTRYKLQYSNDGVNFYYYWEGAKTEDKAFTGGTDRDTVVYHDLYPPVTARFIRFRPVEWYGHISMRVELYGCRLGECQEALGMKNGAISDAQISASSQYDDARRGRLNFQGKQKKGSWSARYNDLNQWLQIDLDDQTKRVTGVATQGRDDYDQWVTKYKLEYSNDGATFHYYREEGESTYKVFAGNKDRQTVVSHDLQPTIRARYIRFRPEAWHKHISMRVELYGCQKVMCVDALRPLKCPAALGLGNGSITDRQISASSEWDSNHAAFYGRLHFKAIVKEMGSWSTLALDSHQWLQVDLGGEYTRVTRVASQGRYDEDQWVISYKLQYSNDGKNFQYYRESEKSADKAFAGNQDRDTVVFHELNPPIRARYIRFRPQAWHVRISMRVELYGCRECQKALGMENGAISDEKITASSHLDANHTAIKGRLRREGTTCKGGYWSAGHNDGNQWLQVDLGGQYTRVTRVATQGSDDQRLWVSKYQLQYGHDGTSFHYYREPAGTEDKEFFGNTNQNGIVYQELNPPIEARYIRFRPITWNGHISMSVELYGCQDDRPCDISQDWCGWRSVHGWKRIKYSELSQVHQEDDDDHDLQNDENYEEEGSSDSNNPGILGSGDYEIHLPGADAGYVSITDISFLHKNFALCFWLNTSQSGFFLEYKVATEQSDTLALGIYHDNNTFRIFLNNAKREVAMTLADNTWHHVCVTREADAGLLTIFRDGERKLQSNGFWSSSQDVGFEGIGTITIGFRVPNKTSSSDTLGQLGGFNIWSYLPIAEEILRMSHGCGSEAGDLKAWETVRFDLHEDVEVKWSRTCRDRKGDRLAINRNETDFSDSAVLVSPPYNRSRDGKSKCLKFRYMLRGGGKKSLTVYQKTNGFREIPIWVSKHNSGRSWMYGQVPLTSVSDFQVLIKGETQKKEDLIALTGLYIEEDNHCKHRPHSAPQACSEKLFDMSGYFFTPSFPGYYIGDMSCTWHINVPSGYVIQVEFLEFQLKNHLRCEDCFIKIFDGGDRTAPAVGRFCGYVYPPVVVSSSNLFTIVIHCTGNLHTSRFKAFYHSIPAPDDAGSSSCSHQQGCPSSCKCEEFGEKQDKRTLVTGEDLLAVPKYLPSNTGAVFFKHNRISQLHEKDFSDLAKLEYIDLSFNVLLRLDEDSFHNVSSLSTLRLNSNFLRFFPVGAFDLRNLRVLDLGRNLLKEAVNGMFDGFSNLEVLSLRANQLTELKSNVFDNNSNMTYLYLQDNKLKAIPDGLFGALSKLKLLNLSDNELRTVTKETFRGLKSLEYMHLDKNKLFKVPSDAFSELTSLKYVKLDRFILCCYAKKSIKGVECDSPVDEFSSCDDLMKNKTLQICIWILGILAFLGNLLVIIWRVLDKEENRVHSFLLTNLAGADMLMGVYLMTIAIMDLKWQGEYFKHDIEWRSGMGCKIVGVLSMLSSEASVLILTVITTDRLISIVFPFKFKRLTYKAAVLACGGVWIFSVIISVVPITKINYFYDENGNFGFYSRSAVCLPLQLSEGTSNGWEYSVFFFIVLNFISFTFILVAYIAMFWTVKRVSRAARSRNLNKESAMAKRLVFIVMTDFCCWMPIIIINILSLTGNFKDPNKIAYVWIAVFVLPVNSSLNPILYTFSTERAKRSLTIKRKNVVGLVMQSLSGRGSGQKRQLSWQKSAADNTLESNVNVDSDPMSLPTEETQEPKRKQVHTKLKLIEEVNLLQGDASEKRSTGYATAWWEEGNTLSVVLLKYFPKESKEDWAREVNLVQGLSSVDDSQTHLLRYRWHSKACEQNIVHGKPKIASLSSSSFLICFDYVSSTTLEDFLCKSGTVLNFDAVCAIGCDVISAIEQLQDLGVYHNNITTSSILIGHCPRVPPIRSVLGGFSQASKMSEGGTSSQQTVSGQKHGNDIGQFGQLLATLLGHFHGSSEYIQLHKIMNLCFKETAEKRPKASYIRELLEEAWFTEGVWETHL